jgi:hypothetical protein
MSLRPSWPSAVYGKESRVWPRCSASRPDVRRVSATAAVLAGASTGDASRRRQMMRGEAIDGSTAVRGGIVSGNSAAAA